MLRTTALVSCWLTAGCAFAASRPEAQPIYRLKLSPFVVTPIRTAGLLVKVRVNGGPELRMLLDSGAQLMVLNRSAARASHCSGGVDFNLVEPGTPGPGTAKQARATSIQVGGLTLSDVPVLIVSGRLPDGIQGVIPLALFAGFLIRLDFPGKTLDLLPYSEGTGRDEGAIPALSSNNLLFLRATVNETAKGLFLLDTGASYVALSRGMARRLNLSERMGSRVPLQGGDTPLDAPLLTDHVRLQFGEARIDANPVVAIDLSTSSRYHRFEVSGLLGYAALCNSAITVNYRDRLVHIAETPRTQAGLHPGRDSAR